MKIEDIKYEVENNKLSKKEILYLYKEYMIKMFRNRDVIDYSKDYSYHAYTKKTNCYAYALGLEIPLFFEDKLDFDFYPGFLSNKLSPNNNGDVLEGIFTDLETLKLSYQNYKNGDVEKNKYLIAIYSELPGYFRDSTNDIDYHFVRRNTNNMWSEKNGYSFNVRQMYNKEDPKGYELDKVLKVNLRSK